ncbi:septum formation protein Maf [Chryseobacterium sp. H3056]|uniref:dTTP/UTP pyrophosphatase n=1 Tax=Kaistella daneshvariae TaxID=2487074 RepID=A0A3N0WSK9_9FLAO|nr:Maf family nucleotide pyrophosphatase [Kaistella daneshvariae]ROI07895.1 septum formation protein Maf [Kaistella daneshvariae]
MKILLGSNSPRRKELLKDLGFDFSVVKIDCEENYPQNLPVSEIAGYLSELKSSAYENLKEDEILLTADTIVVLNETVLGKPENEAQARQMLEKLSGKVHQVFTGITVRTVEKTITQTDVAQVEFEKISSEEIDFYIRNYEPFDKAGSYGIQEWLGMAKIRRISGSFFTIMGLPTHLVYNLLKNFK